MQLSTERLLFREFTQKDSNSIHLYTCDEDVTRFMDWGPYTAYETEDFVKKCIAYQHDNPRLTFIFAVCRIPSEEPIGHIGIQIEDQKDLRANIGYVFARTHWGKGYGSEAVHAILKFGFQELKMHRISATVVPENKASIKILTKLGMIQEGKFRQNKFVRGEFRDNLIFAILNSEFSLFKS